MTITALLLGTAISPSIQWAQAITINNSPGEQIDPHVSGDWVSYTNNPDSSIHYYNFATNIDAQVPFVPALERNLLSDVSGSKIAYSRITGTTGTIMVFDAATPVVAPIEIDPARITALGSAIGGNTVAFIDQTISFGGSLVVHNLLTATSEQLTNDNLFDSQPNVSSDGNVITWESCVSSLANCDILQAVKSGDSWNVSIVANSAVAELSPDTNGNVVVYVSECDSPCSWDLFWRPVAGGATVQIPIPGIERDPSISGDFISFETASSFSVPNDIFLYDMITNSVFQITNTPLIHEAPSDITALPDGSVRIVWTANDGAVGDRNIYGTSFIPPRKGINDLIILGNSYGANTAVLGNSQALLDDNSQDNDLSVCGQLQAFINQVNSNHDLSPTQKTRLVQDANAIKTSIGC